MLGLREKRRDAVKGDARAYQAVEILLRRYDPAFSSKRYHAVNNSLLIGAEMLFYF